MSPPLKPGDEVILTTLDGNEFVDVVDSVSPDGVARLRDTYGSEAWARIDSVRRPDSPAPYPPILNLTKSRAAS